MLSHSLRLRSLRRLRQFAPLARRADHHQPAAVQHAEKLLQFFQGDLLRGKFGLEALLDFVQADVPVEHLQDGVFLLLEAIVVQADGLLDDPVACGPGIAAAARTGRAACESAASVRNSKPGCRAASSCHFSRMCISALRPGLRTQAPSSSMFCTSARTRKAPPVSTLRIDENHLAGKGPLPCRRPG